MQEWDEEPKPEAAAASRKHESIQRDLQEVPRAGDREVSSRDFQRDVESEGQDIEEGSAYSKMEALTSHRVRAGNVGAPAILGSLVPTSLKKKQDDGDTLSTDLTPSQGAARKRAVGEQTLWKTKPWEGR